MARRCTGLPQAHARQAPHALVEGDPAGAVLGPFARFLAASRRAPHGAGGSGLGARPAQRFKRLQDLRQAFFPGPTAAEAISQCRFAQRGGAGGQGIGHRAHLLGQAGRPGAAGGDGGGGGQVGQADAV